MYIDLSSMYVVIQYISMQYTLCTTQFEKKLFPNRLFTLKTEYFFHYLPFGSFKLISFEK